MKIKKESGIKRFQEEKGLGAWFQQLFSVCKSMDNCQPEQTIEPGLSDDDANEEDKSSGHNTSNESSTSCANISASSCPNTSTTSKRTFVPIHETSKKPKRCSSKDVLFETMNSIHEALSNDPTKDLIDYMKEEAKQQKTRDDAFLKLMERIFPPNPATPLLPPQFPPQLPTYPYYNFLSEGSVPMTSNNRQQEQQQYPTSSNQQQQYSYQQQQH